MWCANRRVTQVLSWDLNRLALVRRVATLPEPVTALAVDDVSGIIAAAAGATLTLWTVGGPACLLVSGGKHPLRAASAAAQVNGSKLSELVGKDDAPVLSVAFAQSPNDLVLLME